MLSGCNLQVRNIISYNLYATVSVLNLFRTDFGVEKENRHTPLGCLKLARVIFTSTKLCAVQKDLLWPVNKKFLPLDLHS